MDDNDAFKTFLARIGESPILRHSQVVMLAKRTESGDLTARRLLVEHNMLLVVREAKKWLGTGLQMEDLVQAGTLGLQRAVDKFDYRKGYKFSTYASWWVMQSIQREVGKMRAEIKIPPDVVRRRSKIQEALKKDPELTLSELAGIADCTEDQARDAVQAARVVVSLDNDPVADDTSGESFSTHHWHAVVSAYECGAPDIEASGESGDVRLREAFNLLTPLERDVLALRFGLGDVGMHTWGDVVTETGCSLSTVKEAQRTGLVVLRAILRDGASERPSVLPAALSEPQEAPLTFTVCAPGVGAGILGRAA